MMPQAVTIGNKQLLRVIAAACHMVNRGYCLGIGDKSQALWSEAETWQSDSAVAGVQAALAGDLTPEASHEGWLRHKKAEGWVWGPEKDVAKKEHPCMVPYSELPESQRVKDELFLSTVAEMAGVLGINGT